MQKRTTNFRFQPYGDIFYSLPGSVHSQHLASTTQNFSDKSFDHYYISSSPVYLDCKEGIILLVVSHDGETREEFVIHRVVRLKPDVYFNFVSITNEASLQMTYDQNSLRQRFAPTPYEFKPMISKLHINEILTSYYNVRKGNYIFPGETHDYYELIYIDHGELETNIEGRRYTLRKYDLMLYYPGQFHSMHTKQDQTCSYLTIAFNMDNSIDGTLMNRTFHTHKDIYQALSKFMKSIQTKDYLNHELAMLYLKEVLILLYQFDIKEEDYSTSNPMQEHYENTLLNEILVYIHNNVYTAFTVEDLCNKFSISRSSLQTLFKTNINTTPKQYISNIKLDQAKVLIQEHKRTISEISDILGFTSIHYFSRKFKMQYGMSPTDYSKSINQ
jgi:AraC-like DNA-binding protein/quercetin dioxygenase-like cupin family protein